jgi:RNA polymerase sigma factor (sigma-70 family)
MARGRLGPAAHDFRKLWDAGTVSGLSDAQLLERITANRDEHAFDALIARHGPLVWSVCRSILNDRHDVEDAFQASFLILVRKARSLRVGESLCGWLYRVSYRVAQEARARRARLHIRESSAVDETLVAAKREHADDERLTILRREIDRLHEKYRLPIVLCRLEGMTHQEAADQLGWPPGTVGTRLARGLNLLRARMRRRLGNEAGDQHGWLDVLATSSVPPACRAATARAAVSLVRSGEASAAWTPNALALAQAVQTAAFRTSLRYFTLFAVIAGGTCIALAGLLSGVTDKFKPAVGSLVGFHGPAEQQRQAEAVLKPSSVIEESDWLTFAGKVLDPAGKPFVGAQVYLVLADAQMNLHKIAASAADGRFLATVSRREIAGNGPVDRWRFAKIAATAQGYGPDWASTPVPAIPNAANREDLTLRLAKDDVPIAGRLVTEAGQPVAGARVVSLTLAYGKTASGEPVPWDSRENIAGWTDLRLGSLVPEVASDAEGRFQIAGIGRDRLVTLRITGKDVAQQDLKVQTRLTAAESAPVAGQSAGDPPLARPILGASFVLTTTPARVLEGTVREQGSGKPIAGAIVNTLRTDHGGRFRIDGLSPEFSIPLQIAGPAGAPYFPRRLTVESKGSDRGPVRVNVELSRAILIRGRVIDSETGQPLAGRVRYAPLKGNPNLVRFLGDAQNSQDLDDHGEFAVVGMPGPGAVIVTVGEGETLFFPRTLGASPDDLRRGTALADDELMLNTVPRPMSLVGSHAYQRIDAPADQPSIEVNFALALHPGKTVMVRAVEPSGRDLPGVIAYGLQDPTLEKAENICGDGPFPVQNLDPGWPRRVMFLSPARGLAGFRDLTGDEGAPVTVRLYPGASITGCVVDRAGMPIAGVDLSLVYDDPKNQPHIGFPNGKWLLTAEEMTRDRRLRPDAETLRSINIVMSSSKDGRFQIRNVVPGVRCHLQVIVPNARRLGMKAPRGEGKKPVFDRTLSAGETLELGDVRIVPEELRGKH